MLFVGRINDKLTIGIQIWLIALRTITDKYPSFPAKIGILENFNPAL